MKRPNPKDYDFKPYGYIHDITVYVNELEKQRDELIELLKKVLIVSPISAFKMSELQDEIEELLNKTQSK